MSEKSQDTVLVREVETESATSPKPISRNQSFFPWLGGDEENQKFSAKSLTRFPLLGAVGLLGSAITVLLSFAVLKAFDGHEVISKTHWASFPKPSVWISIILSANGILVHMAASKGISIAWWFRASKRQTTVADLHNIWDRGTSTFSAVTQWKSFDYIALATILVAAIPINGIVLQNAVGSEVVYPNSNHTNTNFSIATSLPFGFSATQDSEDEPVSYKPLWQAAMPKVIGNPAGLYRTDVSRSTCNGLCDNVKVTGIGFSKNCTSSVVPYDFPLNGHKFNGTLNTDDGMDSVGTVFAVEFDWLDNSPYTTAFTTTYKSSSECSGELHVDYCVLELGTVTYTASVFRNVPADQTKQALLEWTLESQNGQFEASPDFKPFTDVEAELKSSSTTYGGIFSSFAAYFASALELVDEYSNLKYQLASITWFATQLHPTQEHEVDGTLKSFPNGCNAYFGPRSFQSADGTKKFTNPSDFILDQYQTTLFYLSLEFGANETQTLPFVDDFFAVSVYTVVWKWWWASVAVTLGIILFILPTFYGFWLLARKTTMSPFETARAFHAPILHDASPELDTPALLKEVGQKNLHTDLNAGSKPADSTGEKID
jgi:hypothetical protein